MNRSHRRLRRAAAALAAAAVATGAFVLIQGDAQAAPGDPLAGFGSAGALDLGSPSGCTTCPDASSVVDTWRLAPAAGDVVAGYDWIGGTTGTEPVVGDDAPERPPSGTALALVARGSVSWHIALEGAPGEEVQLLAVGYQPSPATVIAVVAVVQPGATLADPDTQLRQEIRRFSPAGAAGTTTSLPTGAHGAWTDAAVAPDGTVVGIESGSTGAQELPSDTLRRYDAAGAARWTTTLPTGDAVEDVEVSAAGRVVVAGSTATVDDGAHDGLLLALTDAGALDASFGVGGRIVSPAPAQQARAFTAADVDGDAVAAAGADWWQPTDPDAESDEGPGALVAARTTGGALDPAFDGDGLVVAPWEPGLGPRTDPTDVLVDGARTVVGGYAVQADTFTTDAVLVRRGADGAADDAFVADGTAARGLDALVPVAGGYVAATATDIGADPPPSAWSPTLRGYAAEAGPSSGPPTPGAPTVSSAGAKRADLAWGASGGATGYDVIVDAGLDGTADLTNAVDGSPVSVGELPAGRAFRFALRARDADGLSARSSWSAPAIPPFATVDAFTDRQVRDFLGRAPTSGELALYRSALGGGGLTPVAAIDAWCDSPGWAPLRSPIIRLYQAYFGRLPDPSGLDYWVRRYVSGGRLVKISSTFAASSEFVRTYGTLSNRAFVELVYQNVLGRPGEPSGVEYWTRQLDLRRKPRGQVMLNFSESSEYIRQTAGQVEVINLYTAMLRRIPTTDEVALWGPIVVASGRAPLIEHLLGSDAYDSRIP